MNFINVPVLDSEVFAGGATNLADAEIIGHRLLPAPGNATAFDRYYVAKIRGESLIEERIATGDWVMFKETPKAEPGQLAVFSTPYGLTVKFYFPMRDGTVRLVSANKKFKPQVWLANEITICGVVVTSGRDWSRLGL